MFSSIKLFVEFLVVWIVILAGVLACELVRACTASRDDEEHRERMYLLLLQALVDDRPEDVAAFLHEGADPNRPFDGHSPLQLALWFSPRSVSHLLDAGAMPHGWLTALEAMDDHHRLTADECFAYVTCVLESYYSPHRVQRALNKVLRFGRTYQRRIFMETLLTRHHMRN